ncbi:AAA family ATPase [Thermomonospora cellulosilytica]|uniref:DNA-binding CsgD family transcriptional regulator/type II secretory pathway predicted ATPase ExeA n=1 Tax=Thermomonospora cellulosilytica TaxID=1411118 RepID=A0A7W3N3A6_9ACTN|nr:LuxR family transcriptional regulator [Thermomonospora cellulosilytica]MBA9006788.1 DNA-binding CsgD family transcriptional regulator/type II secretory pathway predicted ATPase ExeA [Thermomonospora cellulosilytica]
MTAVTADAPRILPERGTQLAELRKLLRGDDGRIAVITGPAGCGKTALLEAFLAEAAGSGARVLAATASRTEQNLPLEVVRQLFAWADPGPGQAERVARLLETEARRPSGPRRVPSRVLHEVCVELLALADRPLVVAVDDVRHADTPSLECLLYFARRLRSVPVLLLLTDGAPPRRAHPLFHAELQRLPRFHRVRVPPLSPSGVADLLAAHLDPCGADHVTDHVAGHVHRVSGGSPLLVRALIEDHLTLDRTDPRGRTPAAGEAFRQAVQSLLYRCDPAVRDVARALAVLGGRPDGPVPAHLVGALLDRGAKAAAQATAELNAAGLVDDGRFRHPAARDAVLDDLPPGDRAALHLRAARLLHDGGAAPDEVAQQLLAADPGPEAGWGVPVLQEAAERHLAAGQSGTALRCLRLAERLCADEGRQACITALLAQAEWRIDPAAAVRHAPAVGRALREGLLPPARTTGAVSYLLWYGRVGEAVEALERLTGDRAGEELDDELRAAWLWASHLYPDTARRVPDVAGHGTPPVAGPRLRVAAALDDLLAGDADIAAADVEQRLTGSAGLDDTALALITLVRSSLVHAGRPGGPDFWPGPPGERLSPAWRALSAAARAADGLRRGDLPAAELLARTALTALPPGSWGVGVGGPLATLVLANTAMGRHDEALAHIGTAVPEAMFRSVFGPPYLHARGRHHLATGRPHAALDDFRACGRLMARWGVDRPAYVPWRSGAAEAYTALGEPRRARELVEEQRSLSGPRRMRARGRLSNAELRVAELAARGLTNRQISGRLHITVSTVEQHLTRVYRKLSVGSRADLARLLLPGAGGPA